MPETLKLDADMISMLTQLKTYYNADYGHIIRSLLRERIKKIKEIKQL